VEPHAGEKLQLGFVVRQHGIAPTSIAWESKPIQPYLFAKNEATGQSIKVDARQEGAMGHFVVEVTYPGPGTWQWGIRSEPFGTIPENFEPLTVLPAQPKAGIPSASRWWPLAMALVLGAGVAAASWQGRLKKKTAMGIGGSVGVVGLLLAAWLWPVTTSGAAGSTQPLPATADYGRALFVAKSCSACHAYRGISYSIPGPVPGPNLTSYQADPAFLRQWLRNPSAIRPDTQMPNLNLSEAEIEALIAFLTANSEPSAQAGSQHNLKTGPSLGQAN